VFTILSPYNLLTFREWYRYFYLNNPHRREKQQEEAAEVDKEYDQLWEKHPHCWDVSNPPIPEKWHEIDLEGVDQVLEHGWSEKFETIYAIVRKAMET